MLNKKQLLETTIKLFNNIGVSNIDNLTIDKLLLDIDISMAIDKIERGVASRKLTIGTDKEKLKNKALEIEQRFKKIKFNRILNHIITARYYGYSCLEIIYNKNLEIETLVPINHRYVVYDTIKKIWKIKIGTNEVEMNKYKFLLSIHKWTPDKPKGVSIFESCKTTFLDKEMYRNMLRGLSKKYGDVIVVFPYDENLDEKEAMEQAKAVAGAKGKDVIGIPVSKHSSLKDSFEFIKLSDLDPNIYVELERREKEKLIQKLLGGTLTIDNGGGTGSYALGEVHNQGLEEVINEVCEFCKNNLYQLLEIDGKLNGYDPSCFYFDLIKVQDEKEKIQNEAEKQKILGNKIDNILKLVNAGYKIEDTYIQNYIGIEVSSQNNNKLKEFSNINSKKNKQKRIEAIIEFEKKYNKWTQKSCEKFKKIIANQIKKQLTEENQKEDGIIKLNLDYSQLENDMILSQLTSFSYIKTIMEGGIIPNINPFDLEYSEAITNLLGKTPILYEEVEEITEEIRSNFFWLKKSADYEITKRIHKNFIRNLEKGETFKDFINNIPNELEKMGLDKNGFYIQTVYRTNIQSQYSIGNYKVLKSVEKDFPYWKYSTINDSRTSKICSSLSEKIYKANDPFWDIYFPPNHHNCRAGVIALSKEEIKNKDIETTVPIGINEKLKDFTGNPAKKYWDNFKNKDYQELKWDQK